MDSTDLANMTKSDVYGRLDVTIHDAVYEAGKVSIVTILLRNPFNEPIEVLEIQGPHSSHLSQISRNTQFLSKNKVSTSPLKRKPKWLSSVLEGLSRIAVTEVQFGLFSLEFPNSQSVLNIRAESRSETTIETDLSNYQTVNISIEEGAKVRFLSQTEQNNPVENKTLKIEPYCEAIAHFEISTSGWLFFTPTRRSLSTLVRYRIDGKEKTQVVTSEFDVRPPLLSMVIGAVLGAILGTLAKVLNDASTLEWQPTVVSLGAAIVMSLIATIALSRKTGTQGFITVEDFFGGFVIGALIGYGGSEYFERAIIPPSSSTPTN
jgi:hypothetical protein